VARRVDELVETMGLERYRDVVAAELSTGTRHIVDLAMALAHDPSVLLLDEPSSGIAQKEVEALGPLLLRLQKQTGCTMLVIEHDHQLLAAICDEIVAIEQGKVTTVERGGARTAARKGKPRSERTRRQGVVTAKSH
jgi:branched-chain amino acid transport system ATP-binding protein